MAKCKTIPFQNSAPLIFPLLRSGYNTKKTILQIAISKANRLLRWPCFGEERSDGCFSKRRMHEQSLKAALINAILFFLCVPPGEAGEQWRCRCQACEEATALRSDRVRLCHTEACPRVANITAHYDYRVGCHRVHLYRKQLYFLLGAACCLRSVMLRLKTQGDRAFGINLPDGIRLLHLYYFIQ